MSARPNTMQRLFDLLPSASVEAPALRTIDDLALSMNLPPEAVRTALRRLRQVHSVRSACLDGAWRYGRKQGAPRPGDGRGRERR